MYAVIRVGGKQFRVEENSELKVDLQQAEVGEEVEFRDVLFISEEDRSVVGTPNVKDAVVKAEVLNVLKDKKIDVFKMIPRKGFRRLRGHRQPYTLVQIKEITYGG